MSSPAANVTADPMGPENKTGAGQTSAPVLSLRLNGLAFDDKPILGAVSLDLYPGETLVVTGPSGVGKTSLLRILAGLETAFTGTLTVPGVRAMVFQEPTLLPWRDVRQNICLTTGISTDAADVALHEVGLGALGDRYPGELSLGQQRRLSLARAFALSPDVLLMDEPFVSLDPALVDEMMALFETLRADRSVATVLVTHVMQEAHRLGSRIERLSGAPAVLRAI